MYKDLYGGDNCDVGIMINNLNMFYTKESQYATDHRTKLNILRGKNESQLLHHLKEPHLNLGERYTGICKTTNYESWVTFFKEYVNADLAQRKGRIPH